MLACSIVPLNSRSLPVGPLGFARGQQLRGVRTKAPAARAAETAIWKGGLAREQPRSLLKIAYVVRGFLAFVFAFG
jgi:hypothetical protein